MKKVFLLLTAAVLSVSAFAAKQLYVYSADAVTKGSGARLLPSQAVNLKTGKVVIGLAGRTDVERGECGWYRILPYEGTLETNQYFVCTNYTFNAGVGTANQIGRIATKRQWKTITKYSKLKIYEAACSLGKWEALETWMKATTISNVNIYTAWTNAQYLTNENELFTQVVVAAGEAMGLDQESLGTLLKQCEDGTERVLEEAK